MKEFSKEVIEIAGEEYTLFLNRKGIIAWEKFAKEENEKSQQLQKKYKDFILDEKIEITDGTNPFENLEEIDDMESDTAVVSKSFRKLYWIMLYENHKLSLNEVNNLYDKAIKEYGEQQLIQLATQMIEEANINKMEEPTELKKLPALKPSEK